MLTVSAVALTAMGHDKSAESAAMLGRSPKIVEENPAEVSVRNPDNSRARAILGWSPQVTLREGLTTLLRDS